MIGNRLKRILMRAADKTIVRMTAFLVSRVRACHRNVVEMVIQNALVDSAEYAECQMKEALYFRSKEDLWEFALSHVELGGIVAEFGVFDGYSINYLARKLGRGVTVYGFDSFEGLREDWKGHILEAGAFSRGGRLPKVVRNVELIKGWFDQTLPEFVARHPEKFSFVHIDSDTYQAARSVLAAIGHNLQKGTVVVFDEYFGFRGWRLGEWKAWKEYVESRSMKYEYLAFAKEQVAIKITEAG